MKLRQPTDFLILEALHAYGRNVAPNLAHITGKSRKNVNNRLPVLEDYGLVEKIGPAERSGLYEITDRGGVALRCRDEYDSTADFEGLVERRLEANDSAGASTAMARGGDESQNDPDEQ
ncbi:winged helix-turn-helix transcriptional regulator [Natranaeroarchaeum aerophilus]|uniref:Winged helix-turn-helix transcriptional regulator n=1 Tax=Natranaeroarchaeum aerophilus TaxID=2917711 RepID=A0AAE3FP88_9EURY|nr:winged helix-turn-helix transcriptional regulator [Natranaeroarchaeum aerophilus]